MGLTWYPDPFNKKRQRIEPRILGQISQKLTVAKAINGSEKDFEKLCEIKSARLSEYQKRPQATEIFNKFIRTLLTFCDPMFLTKKRFKTPSYMNAIAVSMRNEAGNGRF